MRISELANRAGVNLQTIRFYEREEVLREPARTASGYRAYSEQDVERVHFIKRCQLLGFTLREIKQLTGLHNAIAEANDARSLREVQAIARERLHAIDEKIQSLQDMRAPLMGLLNDSVCPARTSKAK